MEISYGIGTNLKEADDALSRDKQERERKGLRAPRGERPKGLAAIPAPGVEAEGETPAGEIEEPKTLPANWIDAGWKIEQRGVLQIAISPEGREYTLWGQRLQPIRKPETAIPAQAPKGAIPAPEKLPPLSIITAPSGIYKGWKQATVTEGPHKGVVAFGRDDEEARSAIARDIKSRESSGIGLPEEPPKGAIPAAKETARAPETPAEEEKKEDLQGNLHLQTGAGSHGRGV